MSGKLTITTTKKRRKHYVKTRAEENMTEKRIMYMLSRSGTKK